ncbi:MAG: hypothetical protein EOO26_03710 [Comamonadaceae bacterium]|nr:MAG: hypothetical protein EOO26_03710 [Comamonadaceae bacterium]
MSGIGGIAHITLLCTPSQLASVQAFYEEAIGLAPGARPGFDFPGAWLYAGKQPIVHLAAVLQGVASTVIASSRAALPGGGLATGSIDHVALCATGTVAESRQKLSSLGIPFTEAPVPGFPLHQIFLNDPLGVKIELNFELAP